LFNLNLLTMKKVLLLSLALNLVLGVSAQRIGVKLGANVAGMYHQQNTLFVRT